MTKAALPTLTFNAMTPVKLYPFLLVLAFAGLLGCGRPSQDIDMETFTLTLSDEEAVEISDRLVNELSPDLADNFDISLWASDRLMSDPVQVSMDDQGRAWVSVTSRRRTSVPDIRNHRDWMIETLSWRTVEDKRDFLRRQLATERSDENTWLTDYNEDGVHDWRDLTVEKDYVYLLEDESGNGFANRTDAFTWDIHDEITEIAGGVLYHNGDIYLAMAPDVWRIRDTNGDGIWDTPESISHGYGVHLVFSGHGMSGLTTGPDGRIYWSIGDMGMNVVDKEGNRWEYPYHGAILRSEPDGSNFEVFAKGLRNTHEFSFDKYGNLITVDNDGDHAGEFERLVYLVDGSDSGWRLNWQFGKYHDPKNNEYKVLMDEHYYKPRFEDQAAFLLPPISEYVSGPAGMAYNPGTALSEEWEDHFFIAEFRGSASRSGIHAFSLKESGASFELDNDQRIMQGVLATGLDFGPDGALYFADWIEGWATDDAGRIWKLDTPDQAGSSRREETRLLLAEDFSQRSSGDLRDLLAHDDMRVRQNAQFELASRDDTENLLGALEQTEHQLMRIHGIWGLAQIGRRQADAVSPLLDYLGDEDAEIRAQAIKMLGDVRYEPAADALIESLQDEHARVRFFAAEALGRISWQPAFGPIVDMLEDNDDEDVYLRHGGAIALERIGDRQALAGLADHPSRAVRIAAVVALHRLTDPGVIRFLSDDDEFIVTNAARAINDDEFIEEGLGDLAAMLEQDRFVNEPLIRRAINANLYVGDRNAARRLALFSLRNDIPEVLRAEALNTLSVWGQSSLLDRVTGRYRGAIQNDGNDARRALEPVLADHLEGQSSEVKVAAIRATGTLGYRQAAEDLSRLAAEDSSPDVRIAALQALADLEYEQIDDVMYLSLEDDIQEVRMNALSMMPGLDLPGESVMELIELVLETGSVEEQQTAIKTLGDMDSDASYEALDQQMDRLIAGEMIPEIQLEFVQAVESSPSSSLKARLAEYEAAKAEGDRIAEFRESLYGGNAAEGRRIFYGHEGAQCIRCHVVNEDGSDVGPDLTAVSQRLSREQLLQTMVDPSARIAPGYGSVTITLNDGETISGMLADETETHITVARGDERQEVAKTDIREHQYSPSAMPPMNNILSRDELRDLVEYLSTLDGR